jgi:hypothetical protein
MVVDVMEDIAEVLVAMVEVVVTVATEVDVMEAVEDTEVDVVAAVDMVVEDTKCSTNTLASAALKIYRTVLFKFNTNVHLIAILATIRTKLLHSACRVFLVSSIPKLVLYFCPIILILTTMKLSDIVDGVWILTSHSEPKRN